MNGLSDNEKEVFINGFHDKEPLIQEKGIYIDKMTARWNAVSIQIIVSKTD
jgi:hypothetical protein